MKKTLSWYRPIMSPSSVFSYPRDFSSWKWSAAQLLIVSNPLRHSLGQDISRSPPLGELLPNTKFFFSTSNGEYSFSPFEMHASCQACKIRLSADARANVVASTTAYSRLCHQNNVNTSGKLDLNLSSLIWGPVLLFHHSAAKNIT